MKKVPIILSLLLASKVSASKLIEDIIFDPTIASISMILENKYIPIKDSQGLEYGIKFNYSIKGDLNLLNTCVIESLDIKETGMKYPYNEKEPVVLNYPSIINCGNGLSIVLSEPEVKRMYQPKSLLDQAKEMNQHLIHEGKISQEQFETLPEDIKGELNFKDSLNSPDQ